MRLAQPLRVIQATPMADLWRFVLLLLLAAIAHAAGAGDLDSNDPFGLADREVPLDSPRTNQWRKRLAQMQTGFELLNLLFFRLSSSAAHIDCQQSMAKVCASFKKLQVDWASDLESQADAFVDLEKEGQVQVTAARCADAFVQTRLSECAEHPLLAVISLSESMRRTLFAARQAHAEACRNEVILSTSLILVAKHACVYAQGVCLQDSSSGYKLPADWGNQTSSHLCQMHQLIAAYGSTVRHRIRTDMKAAVAEMCGLILDKLLQAYTATPLFGLYAQPTVGCPGQASPDPIAHGQEACAPGQAVPARVPCVVAECPPAQY